MAYNDQSGNYKPLPFNVERDSIATRVNKEGLIEVVGHDKLRIDYTDSAKGVALLEPSRTNSVTYSEDFSSFSFGRTVRTVSTELTPKGIADSTKVSSQSGTSGTHRFYSNDISVVSGTNYTISIFVKKGTSKKFEFTLLSNIENGIGFNNCIFDFDEKTVTNGNVEDYGNDWFRISLSSTPTTTSVAKIFGYVYDEEGSRTYLSNGNENFYIFGAQLEEGSYPTSYIPTSGSTVQRQADVVNGSGNSEVFNDSEGVLFADIAANSKGGGYKLISLTDSTSGNSFISIGMMNNTTESYKQIRFSGVNLFPDFTDPVNQTDFNKIAIKYKSGNSSFYVNGFEIDSSSVTYTPNAALSELKFSYFNGGDNFYGKTKELGYYDATLTDSELEYLTSYRSLNELVTELNLNTL
jgi:hypothetical protein